MTDTLSPSYPVLPLRDIVVFPHMIVPLFVGREKSVRALEEVMQDDKQILLSSQIDPTVDDPRTDGIYRVGVLANVLQLLKLPDGTVKVLVEGKARVKITEFLDNPAFFEARAQRLDESLGDNAAAEALVRAVGEEFERYAKIKKNIPEEAMASVAETREPARWPTWSPATWASMSGKSRKSWRPWSSPSGWKRSTATCRANCRSCRSRRRSSPASRPRWRRRSASTT
jgi:ATP-dependent Lon protease